MIVLTIETRAVPEFHWIRVVISTKMRLRNDTLYRVVRRVWVGPVIIMWLRRVYIGNQPVLDIENPEGSIE